MTPPALLFSCPSVPARAVLNLPSQCQPPKGSGLVLALPAALSPHAPFHHYSMQWAFLSVKTAFYFTAPSQPVLPPGRWLWSPQSHPQLRFAPLCVTSPSPPSVRLRLSPHCLNLNAPVQLPGFCCNTHSNLSSFKSFESPTAPT